MNPMILDFPNKIYNLIVIDPPWPLEKLTHRARPKQIDMGYKTLSLEDIKNLPVSSLADSSCWLFLWTIQKYLFIAKDILSSWGFNYLLTMVWEKTYGKSSGMPLFGFRWNAEFILVGCRHKPSLWPKQKLIPVAFSAENTQHSAKPDLFYILVEHLGDRRIDLFARKERNGWDVWGDRL